MDAALVGPRRAPLRVSAGLPLHLAELLHDHMGVSPRALLTNFSPIQVQTLILSGYMDCHSEGNPQSYNYYVGGGIK